MDPTPETLLTDIEKLLSTSTEKINSSLVEQIGHFSTAEIDADADAFDESQYKVTPVQRSLIALCVRGFSLSAACRKLHANYSAASRWKKTEWWVAVEEEERAKWLESEGIDTRKQAFSPLVAPALRAISESLDSEDDKIRLAAANLVFEQFFGQEKRGPGRPPLPKPEDNQPPDLSTLRLLAERKIAETIASARTGNGFSVVANG